MALLDFKPILQHTIDRILAAASHDIHIIIAAPEFDKGNDELPIITNSYQHNMVTVFYGDSESPLRRIVNATSYLNATDFIIRVNGINFCLDAHAALKNYRLAMREGYDCVRFQEDFPALFTSDIYRVGALREVLNDISDRLPEFHIHPKYYMAFESKYRSFVYRPDISDYPDTILREARSNYKKAMHKDRVDVDMRMSISVADTFSFHYIMAKKYLSPHSTVVDLACGSGFGTRELAHNVFKVIGLDLDCSVLDSTNMSSLNASFVCANALSMPFESCSIDAVVAFEIIEHIPPQALLDEIFRVLRPGGVVCLSTPQNCLGHIPTTSAHMNEFSLNQIRELITCNFIIEDLIGIKQGTIYYPGDDSGSNTFVVAIKPTTNVERSLV